MLKICACILKAKKYYAEIKINVHTVICRKTSNVQIFLWQVDVEAQKTVMSHFLIAHTNIFEFPRWQ